MQLTRKIISVTLLSFFTSKTQAFISVQGLAGYTSPSLTNSADKTKHNLKGQMVQAALYLDPIPLVPVSAGLAVAIPNSTSSTDSEFKEYGGLDVSLQVSAWSPIRFFGLLPYAKLGILALGKRAVTANKALTAAGQTTATTTKVAIDYDVSGTDLAVGLNYSPLPLIALLFEVQMQSLALTPSAKTGSVEVLGTSVSYNKDKYTGQATNLLLGVQVGI